MLADMPAVMDFVTDALAHHKFIAHNEAASPLFKKAGVEDLQNHPQLVALSGNGAAGDFINHCRKLRHWGE